MSQVRMISLGLQDYKKVWDLQEAMLAEKVRIKTLNRDLPADRQTGIGHDLLFVEHPHVYTLGKSGHAEHLLVPPDQLHEIGATYYHINRGGDITYHGPGQLVGYPIFDLEQFQTDINWYLRNIEEAIIRTLAEYGLVAGRIPGLTGVWLGMETEHARKICAIGIRCSRWITMHGFAFNINTDLSYFGHIVPCGISDKAVTSMAIELNHTVDFQQVSARVLFHLSALFGFTPEMASPESVGFTAFDSISPVKPQ